MISIIIINYNTFQLTCNCIQSILNFTTYLDYEIILVDNASSECQPEIFKEKFPDIKLIISNENLGYARGNNLGIQNSKGDIILLLNSDTELLNNGIKIGVDYLSKNKNTGVVTGQLSYPDGRIQDNCQRFPSIKYLLIEKFRIHKFLTAERRGKLLFGHYFNYLSIASPDWVWGTFFMFKKEILNSFPNNKLHDEFFMYIEDMQWCFHVKKVLKMEIIYLPDIKIKHYLGGSNGKTNINIQENLNKLLFKINSKFVIRVLNLLK